MAIQRFRYSNATDHELRVIVEPWANQYRIRPAQQIEVVIDIVVAVDPADCLEIEHTPDGLILYAATGSTVTLMADGAELASEPQDEPQG